MSDRKTPTVSTLSLKRLQDIRKLLEEKNISNVDDIIAGICEIMKFDPDYRKGLYKPEHREHVRAWREKKAKELNISVSMVANGKYKTIKPCTNYLCEEHGYEKYKGYCIRCFVHMFPDEPVTRGFKTKESTVVQWIKETYLDKEWIFDRKVDNGCSRFRPDIFLDLLTHSVIIEIDENQHESYENMCENKRMMSLFEDLGNRPLVLIRFNPDSYTNLHGTDVESCFVYKNQNGLPSIRDPKKWKERLETLKNCIDHHMNTVPEKEVTVEHMYYDGCEY